MIDWLVSSGYLGAMMKDKNTLDFVKLIAQTSPDAVVRRDALRIQRRLGSVPIGAILARVPGDTIVAKCKLLGITRATYYSWASGTYRPRGKALDRLAKITGVSALVIRGHDVGIDAPR